jgi:hypothetical protein
MKSRRQVAPVSTRSASADFVSFEDNRVDAALGEVEGCRKAGIAGPDDGHRNAMVTI